MIPADTDLRRLTRSVNAMCAPALSIARCRMGRRRVLRTILGDGTHLSVCGVERPVAPSAARTIVVARPSAARRRCHEHRRSSLLGEHDFSSFCRRPKPAEGMTEPSLVRRLQVARWDRVQEATWGPGLLQFEISATSFCHQMVRSIVGHARRRRSWTARRRLDPGDAGGARPQCGRAGRTPDRARVVRGRLQR